MAYAAVISLKHTIHRLKNPINLQITKSAYDELNSLVSTLKRLDDRSSRSIDRSVINELDAKIREAVWKLEDVLESYQRLDEQEIDSFLKTVKILREEYNRVLQKPLSGDEEEDEAAAVPAENKSTTVGFSDLSEEIRNELLHGTSELKAVALVGMAGIGKTHLATQIYHHPVIVQNFDSRLWVRVGPKDQIENIFVAIVAQIESKPRDLFKEKDFHSLIDLLRSSLRGRRYLIVFDDIWSIQVFNHFTDWLPDYRNRCRFLLTTRLEEVAKYYRRTKIHRMPFLNDEESWNLLRKNVFGEKSLSSELEKAGRKIAENCEGLPLLILAVANILCGLDKTEEYWKKVAERKTTTFTDAYDQIYKVLFSSYEYLPQCLKPCFLYMGIFPQRCEIPISKLINLWGVEDFLEPSQHRNLEEIVMESMEDLVSKSLAIICKRSFERFSRIKSSKLHSTYWYLCVTEARKSKFFHVLNKLTDVPIERVRRFSVQNNVLLGLKEAYDSMVEATSTTRSLLCTGEDHQYPVLICFNMMLLMRVLDALAIRFYEFPNEVLKLLQLRYLSLTHNGELPSSINKLQQLQCLILRRHHNIIFLQRDSSCLPQEIWDMQELRDLRIMGSNLPNPSKGSKLPKLLTLYVNANSCTEAIFRSIPNLRKLGMKIELQSDTAAETLRCFEYIGLLNELESLKCVVVNPRLTSQLAVPPADHLSNLPWRLKKLSLNGLGYSWKHMSRSGIGSLMWLKVLKLRCYAFQGSEWETESGKFKNLEYLLLEDIDLVHFTSKHRYIDDLLHWTPKLRYVYLLLSKIDSFFRRLCCKLRKIVWGIGEISTTEAVEYGYGRSFPRLRHLIVRRCHKLKKIPSEIGEIPTLERIEVDDCSPAVVDSVQQIKERTKPSLQLSINSSWSNF